MKKFKLYWNTGVITNIFDETIESAIKHCDYAKENKAHLDSWEEVAAYTDEEFSEMSNNPEKFFED